MEAITAPAEALTKPEVFGSWGERLDYIHHNFHYQVHDAVDRIDTYFAEDASQPARPPPSKLRLGLYAEFEIDAGVRLALDPDYDLEVELPNLEQRWNIIVTGRDVDELPGTNPTERDAGANVGIQKPLDRLHVKVGAGVKLKWLPEGFAEAKWSPLWRAGAWRFRPQLKGYYQTDDGLGSIESLTVFRWFGARQRGFLRSVTAGRWTENTEGYEWEQSLALGYVPQLLQSKHRDQNISAHDTARAVGVRYSILGHKDSEAIVDRHRVTLAFRFPLYKNFIYGEVLPELDFENVNDWDPVQKIRLGVDMLFWGVGESPL
jgi:hypothetical protein